MQAYSVYSLACRGVLLVAKRRYDMDSAKVAKWQREGRGKGHGCDYLPWIEVHDISSRGLSMRVPGWTTGRQHHLLSQLEAGLFYLYDWMDAITDIREQFPLDQALTQQIAKSIGIKHPTYSKTNDPIVMTTDFVLDQRCLSGTRLLARTVKPSEELSAPYTIEKFEIERRYWTAQGVDWGVVTEKELPAQFIKNIRWVHDMRTLDQDPRHPESYWLERREGVLRELQSVDSCTSLRSFQQHMDDRQGSETGTTLALIRHFIAQKILIIDMQRPLNLKGPVSQLTVAPAVLMMGRSIA